MACAGETREPVYMCDPSRNKKCRKTGCFYRDVPYPVCYATKDKKCAQLDEKGEPVKIDWR